MPVSRVEILSSIALALVTMSLASGIPTSNASTTYQPGVHVGDWWKYQSINVTCVFYCPPELQVFQNITLLNSAATDVAGDNVTLKNGVTFTNGTVRTATLSGNIETGQGNLTYQTLNYLISGGLTQGDRIYNSPTAPTINTTMTDSILGVERHVNILEVSNSLYTLEQEWDRASGILVAVRLFSSVGISASIYLTDVIWSHTPDFTVQFSAYRGSLAIELGETVNTTVKVQSLRGFKGSVNLTATVQPEGPVLRLDPSTVEVPDYVHFKCGDFVCYRSGWANSTLSISAPQNIPAGTYTATITAANQTVSRSVQLTVTISRATSPTTPPTAPPPSSGTGQGQNTFFIFGLAPLLFYGFTGGALALFASILILLFLTGKRKSPYEDDSQNRT